MHLLLGVRNDSSLWFYVLLSVMGLVGVAVGLAVGVYLVRKYQERKWGWCDSKRRMEGKVVVITGANSGIGKETARDLASRGAIVIMACRDRQAALDAVKDIRKSTADGDLIVMELDLGDLESVRTFAANLLDKFTRVDVLVNNAGVYMAPEDRRKTKDGFEVHFGVNHLGHFLLTMLLMERIRETHGSRIVIVSSMLYKTGEIDFDNLDAEKGWKKKGRNALYSNSKLANILHGQELVKRMQGSSTGVYVLCPGFVYTGLMRYTAGQFSWFKKMLFAPIAFFHMRSAKQGAQSSIHCAVSEQLDGVAWAFLRDCKVSKLEAIAEDPDTAARLWDVSMTLVGERAPGRTFEDDVPLIDQSQAGDDVPLIGAEEGTALVDVAPKESQGDVQTLANESVTKPIEEVAQTVEAIKTETLVDLSETSQLEKVSPTVVCESEALQPQSVKPRVEESTAVTSNNVAKVEAEIIKDTQNYSNKDDEDESLIDLSSEFKKEDIQAQPVTQAAPEVPQKSQDSPASQAKAEAERKQEQKVEVKVVSPVRPNDLDDEDEGVMVEDSVSEEKDGSNASDDSLVVKDEETDEEENTDVEEYQENDTDEQQLLGSHKV